MRRLTLGILLLVTGLAAAKDPPKGFVPFFNGKDLTGWHGMPHCGHLAQCGSVSLQKELVVKFLPVLHQHAISPTFRCTGFWQCRPRPRRPRHQESHN